MGKILKLFFFSAISVFWWACSDNDDKRGEGSYNPDLPVEVTSFMPNEGKLREKVVIKGSNFGNDKSKVNVFFVDDFMERRATIIGVDNNTIYCLAPRQNPGNNSIKVSINDKEVITEDLFSYSQSEVVSTIVGTTKDRQTKDGSLSEGRMGRCTGIAAIGNESVLVFQGHTTNGAGVRLVSIPDNKVITIQSGFEAGKPAVKKNKSTVYAIGKNAPHTVYQYAKEAGWTPMRIGQLGSQYTQTLFNCAMDNEEEWLYFVDNGKMFGRFNINNQTTEIINEKLAMEGSGNIYITYHPFHDCFYASSEFTIYKLEKNGTVTLFSGASNRAASTDGPIADASFYKATGLTVDEEGDIYITQAWNGHQLIRKIMLKQDYVGTIAGVKGANEAQVDGNPLESKFHWPSDICYDGEGGFWISEDWGCAVRKYAIE